MFESGDIGFEIGIDPLAMMQNEMIFLSKAASQGMEVILRDLVGMKHHDPDFSAKEKDVEPGAMSAEDDFRAMEELDLLAKGELVEFDGLESVRFDKSPERVLVQHATAQAAAPADIDAFLLRVDRRQTEALENGAATGFEIIGGKKTVGGARNERRPDETLELKPGVPGEITDFKMGRNEDVEGFALQRTRVSDMISVILAVGSARLKEINFGRQSIIQ
jgi:hypothetical protein